MSLDLYLDMCVLEREIVRCFKEPKLMSTSLCIYLSHLYLPQHQLVLHIPNGKKQLLDSSEDFVLQAQACEGTDATRWHPPFTFLGREAGWSS